MGVIGLLFTMYRHLCCSYLWFSRINACLCFTLADFWMVCLKSCCAKLSKIIIHYSLLVHIRHFKEKLFIVCTSGNIIFCLPACLPAVCCLSLSLPVFMSHFVCMSCCISFLPNSVYLPVSQLKDHSSEAYCWDWCFNKFVPVRSFNRIVIRPVFAWCKLLSWSKLFVQLFWFFFYKSFPELYNFMLYFCSHIPYTVVLFIPKHRC